MNNFGKRAISGFLFVVILTACIYIHPFCFFALFFIINIIGLLEFSHMAEVIHIRVNRTMCILSGSLLFITISVIKKVICFSSVPHSLWGFGNCTGRVPMLFRIWLSGFMLCFISPCPLLC